MRAEKKLNIYYFIFGISLTGLVMGIFMIMSSIDSTTSLLERKLVRRNLFDIADKDYKLNVQEPKEERVDFLNSLTDFFFEFHENTMNYRRRLSDFMSQRTEILQRFNRTNILFHNMTIIPNLEISKYLMKQKVSNEFTNKKEMRNSVNFVKVKRLPMEDIIKIETVAQFNAGRGQKTLHPLVTILDQSISRQEISVPAAHAVGQHPAFRDRGVRRADR